MRFLLFFILHTFSSLALADLKPHSLCFKNLRDLGLIREGNLQLVIPSELESIIQRYAPEGRFDLFELGSGAFGSVYRLRNTKSGKEHILKLYKVGREKIAENDFRAFQILSEVFRDDKNLRIVELLEFDTRVMVLENNYGLDLKQYKKHSYPDDVSKTVKQESFYHFLVEARKKLQLWADQNGYNLSFDSQEQRKESMSLQLKKDGKTVRIFLKEDNVLVDESGRLVLIDPF